MTWLPRHGALLSISVVAGLALAGGLVGEEKSRPSSQPKAGAVDLLKGMIQPEYDSQGGLLRPVGYERWIFAGTSLGISYSEGDDGGPGDFHNIYVQPQAFDHYVQHGEFPEKTVFVMTNSPATKKKGADVIIKRGHFAGRSKGLEVAVKDSARFEDGWAYFIFPTDSGARTAAKAFARKDCFDCHAEHADADNVFVQFYSVLDAARPRKATVPKK